MAKVPSPSFLPGMGSKRYRQEKVRRFEIGLCLRNDSRVESTD